MLVPLKNVLHKTVKISFVELDPEYKNFKLYFLNFEIVLDLHAFVRNYVERSHELFAQFTPMVMSYKTIMLQPGY